MDIPLLDLPDYASQVGGTITVETAAQAFDVLDYIPAELDDSFGVVISNREESHQMAKINKAFGL